MKKRRTYSRLLRISTKVEVIRLVKVRSHWRRTINGKKVRVRSHWRRY